ncbi:DUF6171 family protein [Paenibacillus sp. LHD-117]|uniref:DUF6171 family protein n=1 Tax=Paenibacillus sp. LHD-117 TaxID=3071412 RepID=UPI0027DF7936|nr:DUF6171 family protein [Paenibacillus sp. LHD-117]MDQ6421789.1 DUF6171 family protein [Paenibacillus sp. LHD-117]
MREHSPSSCRGCDPAFRVSEADIDRVLAAPMFQSAEHAVPDNVYESRLALCRACPKLAGGTTCIVCGCYVRVAAKLKARSCPMPGNSQWQAYAAQ